MGPILCQLLRPLRVLLQQIMSLREPQQTLDECLVVVYQRLHARGECLDSEWRWEAISTWLGRMGAGVPVLPCVIERFERAHVEVGE